MTPRPRIALLVALLLAAALAAGCAPQQSSSSKSASRFTGDQRAAAQTVEDLDSAAGDSDEVKICTQILSRALAARIAASGRGCAPGVDAAMKDADSTAMTVEAVRVTGNSASARVKFETGKKDRRGTITLVREGGRWRVSGL